MKNYPSIFISNENKEKGKKGNAISIYKMIKGGKRSVGRLIDQSVGKRMVDCYKACQGIDEASLVKMSNIKDKSLMLRGQLEGRIRILEEEKATFDNLIRAVEEKALKARDQAMKERDTAILQANNYAEKVNQCEEEADSRDETFLFMRRTIESLSKLILDKEQS